MKEEGFLEYINQLLMTGEVAGLLPKEELESILNDVRPVFKRECFGAHSISRPPFIIRQPSWSQHDDGGVFLGGQMRL